MPSEGMGAIGALDWTSEERKKLAVEVILFYSVLEPYIYMYTVNIVIFFFKCKIDIYSSRRISAAMYAGKLQIYYQNRRMMQSLLQKVKILI